MNRVTETESALPDATQKTKDPEKKQEMERAQEEAANERATEGGYQ
ncbi:MAG TPA: hypothetical protein VM842_06290 [Nitrospira sp.]|nr:hypothetical protein [Nitrospira sp.]